VSSAATRARWRLLLGAAASLVLIALLVHLLDLAQLRALLARSDPRLLVAAFAMHAVNYLVRAVRLAVLLPRAPIGRLFAVTCVHHFLLRVVPLRAGELSFPILAQRTGLSGFGQGAVTLVLVRVLDMAVVALLFVGTLAVAGAGYQGRTLPTLLGAGGLVVGSALLLGFARPLSRWGLTMVKSAARVTGLSTRPWVARQLGRLEQAIEWFLTVSPAQLGGAALTSVLQWLLLFVMMYLLMGAFGVAVSLPQAILGGTGAAVAGILPVGLIGNFGTLEAGWALGFTLAGVAREVAVASAVGFSLATLVYSGVLAVGGWLFIGGRLGARPADAATESTVPVDGPQLDGPRSP
jgi:uncharacterized protein (TIRG00374 family)